MEKISKHFWLLVWSFVLTGHLCLGQKLPAADLTKSGSEFYCVAINPDNRIVATGDQHGKIYLWDVTSKSIVNTLEGENVKIIALAFSNDGSFLAAAGKDNSIAIWSTRHGVKEKTLVGHQGTITKIAFSPDNRFLASGSVDKKVIIWDFVEGKVHHTIADNTKEITSVAFTADGKILVTGGYDGIANFWNTGSWKLEKKISPASGRIRSVAFSPDDKFVAIGTDKKGVQIYEVYSGYLYKSVVEHKDIVYDLQFSSDGRYLFTGSLDNSVKVYELEAGRTVATLTGYYNFISLAGSADGKWLGVADISSKLKLYDLSELKIKSGSKSLQLSSASLAGDIHIELFEPVIPFDSVFHPESNKISIKGKVVAKNGISEFKINNEPVKLLDNGFFQYEARIPMGRWSIPFTARDFNNQVVTKKLVTERSADPSAHNNLRNGKDYALLIASDQYSELQALNNPVFDATTIQKDLEEVYGFETNLLKNPTKSQVLEVIRDYSMRQYASGDQLLIFVAGHGVYDEVFKQGYIAARDSKKTDDVKDSYIPYSNFRDYVNNIPCKHLMVVLDVCFGGTFNPLTASRGQQDFTDMDRDLFIINKMKYTTRKYITSGGKQYVSDGAPGSHSPFARRFIEAIRGRGGEDGIVTYNEMVGFIEKVSPGPTFGEFGNNEPGSDFLFITKRE